MQYFAVLGRQGGTRRPPGRAPGGAQEWGTKMGHQEGTNGGLTIGQFAQTALFELSRRGTADLMVVGSINTSNGADNPPVCPLTALFEPSRGGPAELLMVHAGGSLVVLWPPFPPSFHPRVRIHGCQPMASDPPPLPPLHTPLPFSVDRGG